MFQNLRAKAFGRTRGYLYKYEHELTWTRSQNKSRNLTERKILFWNQIIMSR